MSFTHNSIYRSIKYFGSVVALLFIFLNFSRLAFADSKAELAIIRTTSELCSSRTSVIDRNNRQRIFSSLAKELNIEIPEGDDQLSIWDDLYNYGNQDACIYMVSGYIFTLYVKSKNQIKKCRHPSHGIESYRQTFVVTKNSGWRKGGYDPTKWCNDVIVMLKAKHPESKLEVVSKRESDRDSCRPFNCIEYQYECSIKVMTNPIYREASSAYCE